MRVVVAGAAGSSAVLSFCSNSAEVVSSESSAALVVFVTLAVEVSVDSGSTKVSVSVSSAPAADVVSLARSSRPNPVDVDSSRPFAKVAVLSSVPPDGSATFWPSELQAAIASSISAGASPGQKLS